jgi:hypothetical protein
LRPFLRQREDPFSLLNPKSSSLLADNLLKIFLIFQNLAEYSGICFALMMRLESFEGVPASNFKTLESIKQAFEKAGIEFIGTPESGAGVRWKT